MFAQLFAGVGIFAIFIYETDMVMPNRIEGDYENENNKMFSTQNLSKFNDDTFLAFNGVWISTTVMFSSCYFPNKITTYCSDIGNIVYQSEWYRLSPKLQKYLQLVIKRSQRPVFLHGFKIIRCSMETFSKVGTYF